DDATRYQDATRSGLATVDGCARARQGTGGAATMKTDIVLRLRRQGGKLCKEPRHAVIATVAVLGGGASGRAGSGATEHNSSWHTQERTAQVHTSKLPLVKRRGAVIARWRAAPTARRVPTR